MHQFLRAIGFGSTPANEHELDLLLDNLLHTCDNRIAVREEGEGTFLELTKSVGPDVGLCLCGIMDEYGFHRLYYFPYYLANHISSREELSIEVKTSGNGYAGMLEEGKIGVSLIFYVQNPGKLRKVRLGRQQKSGIKGTTLTALSTNGMILLPLKKEDSEKRSQRQKYYERYDSLVTSAKNGNQEAIESLTIEDMDTYSMIARRIQTEDVYTIVESSFMPFGMESDQYQILGTICFYTKVRNFLTQEYLYQLTVECNGMTIGVCINETDLLGEPEVGRRFKGNIWLQGRVRLE